MRASDSETTCASRWFSSQYEPQYWHLSSLVWSVTKTAKGGNPILAKMLLRQTSQLLCIQSVIGSSSGELKADRLYLEDRLQELRAICKSQVYELRQLRDERGE